MQTFEFLKLILSTRKDIVFVVSILFFSLLLSFLEVLSMGMLFPFLDVMQNAALLALNEKYRFIASLFHLSTQGEFILFCGIFLILAYLCRGVLSIGVTYMQNYFAYKKQRDVASELFDSYLNAPYRFHLEKNSSVLIKNITVEASNIMLLLQEILSLVLELIILFCLMGFLIYLNWKITAMLIVFAVVYHYGLNRIFLNRIKISGNRREAIQSRAFRDSRQAFASIKNIKIDNKSAYFVSLFHQHLKEIIRVGSYFRTMTVVPKAIVEVLLFAGVVSFLLIKVKATGFDPKLIPLIGVYGFALYRIVPSLNKITVILMNMKFFTVSLDIVGQEIKGFRMRKKEGKSKIFKDCLCSNISIRNLAFRHKASSPYLFYGVNLDIRKGEKILLFGESGSGKSTFIDLLAGLLEPELGTIAYDDILLNSLDVSKLIGYLPQDVKLLDSDLISNIAFGDEKKDVDKRKVLVTLENVNLNTLTGSLTREAGEDGVKLSGGQRQRIGLARIFYRDKDILLLDEFSSALDAENEKRLIEEIMTVFKDKTIIAVTHKTYLARYFDTVYKKTASSFEKITSKEDWLNENQ